jgi:hypothetical protein
MRILSVLILFVAFILVSVSSVYAQPVPPPIPEPSTILLFSAGAIGAGIYGLIRWKRQRKE